MSIPRAKKKKSKKPQREPFEIVMLSNYLNMAIVIRTLWTEYGWRDKRIARFIDGYLALMQEVADGRATVQSEIADCKALTGVDVKKLIDELYAEGRRKE